jgi:hypothetical protein
MQPSTPPRQITRCVNGHDINVVPVANSDHSKQFDGQLSPSATDARPHWSDLVVGAFARGSRSLALDHGSV